MSQAPSIGRIVLFTLFNGVTANGERTHPAIITHVWGKSRAPTGEQAEMVNLTVFPDCGQPFCSGSIYQGEPGQDGRWAWPERA